MRRQRFQTTPTPKCPKENEAVIAALLLFAASVDPEMLAQCRREPAVYCTWIHGELVPPNGQGAPDTCQHLNPQTGLVDRTWPVRKVWFPAKNQRPAGYYEECK